MDGEHTDDAHNGCQDGGAEVVDEGSGAHATTGSWVQLRQSCRQTQTHRVTDCSCDSPVDRHGHTESQTVVATVL